MQRNREKNVANPPEIDLSGLEIEIRSLADLKPHPRNPRTHDEAAIEQVADLIRRFGWTVPIVLDERGTILAGHKRRLAAQRLGMTEAPTVTVRGLSADEKLAYVIADNQSTFRSPWDEALLGVSIEDLERTGFDIPLLGFDEDFVQGLGAPQDPTAPDQFPEFGDDIETNRQCPKCGYEWSDGH